MRVNGTLVEDKMRRFKGECEHISFNKCPIYTHDGASAKFSPNSQEMDNSVLHGVKSLFILLFDVRKGSLRLKLENVLCHVLPHVIRVG